MSDQRDPSRALAPAVFAASAAVLLTVVPADIGFRDAGELGTASFVLGVPHPTGFPLDMLLLRLGATIPVGSIALRQNATVALMASLALALLAELVARLARRTGVGDSDSVVAGAVVAAVGLGTWATFFATAVLVEVYSTSVALIALAALGALSGSPRGRALVWLALGLSLGAHVAARIAIAPLAIVAFASAPPANRWRSLLPAACGIAAGALLIAYLPLASMHDPPVDWGDPETLSRLLDHLSASRIREAYGSSMLTSAADPTVMLFAQLGELWPLFPPAILGAVVLVARERRIALMAVVILAADLLYATRINPMGIDDRQVGHVAGAVLALVAGIGIAVAIGSLSRARGGGIAGTGLACLLAAALVARTPDPWIADGHAATELVGSGGALGSLPPRTVGLCASDDACAGALFALHVDGVRPDVLVLPAQHLWDPIALRSLATRFAWAAREARVEVSPAERGLRAERVAQKLLMEGTDGTVFAESAEVLRTDGLHFAPTDLVGWVRPVAGDPADADFPRALALQMVARAATARDAVQPRSPWAAQAWAHAYDSLARAALDVGDPWLATRGYARAVAIAPGRATLWTNYGVALRSVNDLDGAITACEQAILLDPGRTKAWVNLIRYLLEKGDRHRARRAIEAARALGITDPRIDAELDRP